MKTRILQNSFLTITTIAALTLAAETLPAQDASADQTAPQLSYGVSQIVQLSKANISEDTILTYVQNSGNNYGLDANQIVYLKQQGVSDPIVNAMLNQRNNTAATQTASAPVNYAQPTTYVQAAPTYVPASTVYVIPDTQTYNYYAGYRGPYYSGSYTYYGWPPVSLSIGFGGGCYGGYSGGYPGNVCYIGNRYGGWHR